MPRVSERYLEARRESIIGAARRAFARSGPQATTMAQVATEAGLTPGAIYRYFATKDALIDACFGQSRAAVARQLGPATAAEREAGTIERIASEAFAQLRDPEMRPDTVIHLEHLLDMVREGRESPLAAAREERARVVRRLDEALGHASAAGRLRPGVDTAGLAEALLSFYWGARLARMVDPTADTDIQLTAMLDMLLGERER